MTISHIFGPPHACGDDAEGISPDLLDLRSTPTRVGTTMVVDDAAHQWPSVHPHACGDDAATPAFHRCARSWLRSTPTRVGTTLGGHVVVAEELRSTPTRVGTTRRSEALTELIHTGPPPRVWGRRYGSSRVSTDRSTPTRVGTTGSQPRALERALPTGPPPRVWGRHFVLPNDHGILMSWRPSKSSTSRSGVP